MFGQLWAIGEDVALDLAAALTRQGHRYTSLCTPGTAHLGKIDGIQVYNLVALRYAVEWLEAELTGPENISE